MTSIEQASSKSKKKPRNAASRNGKGPKAKKSKTKTTRVITPDNWAAWTKHMAKRKTPRDLRDMAPGGKASPLAWGLPRVLEGSPTADLLGLLHKFTSRKRTPDAEVAHRLEQWTAGHDGRDCSVPFALDCLAWCHALPRLVSVLPAAPWCQLFELLIDVAESGEACDLQDDPLAHQLQFGELAGTLAYLFPQQERCARLFDRGRAILSHGLLELHDGEGLLHAQDVDLLPSLLACWTRAELLARAAGKSIFESDAANQYEWLVRQAVRLTRWDGSLIFDVDASSTRWNKHLMRAALVLNDDAADDAIAARVLPPLAKSSVVSSRPTKEVPDPATYSEWSELYMGRTEWKRDAPQLGVAFADRDYRCELSVAKEIVWSGYITPHVVIDGQRHDPISDWSETCWFSDVDADYLEVECDLENGWVVQRQMLLARQGKFIYFADNLLGEAAGDIEYSMTLPLPAGVTFDPAAETREGRLVGSKPLAVVIPLALPEWRTQSSGGTLESTEDGLVLTQNAQASRMCVPLYVDLQSKRFDKPLTWRRLTVAEQLQIQPSDVAVGYRVQAGKSQWLVYRSLAPATNRTLLGQNLSNEFICAKFKNDGTLDELIEIE